MIESITVDMLLRYGLPFLAVVFFLEGALIGKFLPTDLLLPVAVVLYATQEQYYFTLLLITATSSTAGQFWLFRRFKTESREDIQHSHYVKMSDENIDRLFDALDRRGLLAVTISNCIPGVRGLLTIPAAIEGFDESRFVTASATGTLIFQSALILIGAGIVNLL